MPYAGQIQRHPSATLFTVVLALGWHPLAAQDSQSRLPAPDFTRARSVLVRAVIDERTLLVGDGREEWRVPLIGVASPRWNEAAAEARLYLDRLLSGESVYLVEPNRDETSGAGVGSERRPAGDPPERPAYVYRAPDGLFVNLELVRLGYAPVAAREQFEHRSLFRTWEERARLAEKGLWARPDHPTTRPRQAEQERSKRPPTATQPAPRTNVKLVYVTPKGERYHLPDCPALRGGGRAISLEEARKRYSPCSRCKPPP
jgi:endonuclease YncB( thermonuclease family)